MGKNPRTHFTIQRKSVGASAGGQYQKGLGAIEGIAGRNLLTTGLQEIGFGGVGFAFRHREHRKNGADGNVDVDIARSVQRIEEQQVIAVRIGFRDGMDRFHFLGSDSGQIAAPFVGFQKDFIGKHIQFFLDFSLYVFRFVAAQNVSERSLAYGMADRLTGTADDFQKQAQFFRNGAVSPVFLDQVLRQTDAFWSHDAFFFFRCDVRQTGFFR